MQIERDRSAPLSAKVAIVVVGFGNMGQALVRGWLAKGRAADSIRVVDPATTAHAVARELGVAVEDEVAAAEVVLLAVKPNQLAEVLPRCGAAARAGAVFLSIAAGKTLPEIGKGLGGDAAIVRAMPNTPAAIGQGITALVANAAVSRAQRALCGELLAAVGSIAWLDEERHMDAVTAISGSGPAYVFYFIEALQDAARQLGMNEAQGRALAVATFTGAAQLAANSAEPPSVLRERVTSKGGTTAAALASFDASGIKDAIVRGVLAADARAKEMGDEFGKQ